LAFAAPGAAGFSRKQLDELTEKAKLLHRARLFRKSDGGGVDLDSREIDRRGNVKKLADVAERSPEISSLLFLLKNNQGTEAAALIAGNWRLQLGEASRDRQIAVEIPLAHGFPLFEWSESDKTWVKRAAPLHRHRRRRPGKSNPPAWEVRSKGYDLVLNATSWLWQHPNPPQDIQERLFKG